MPIDPRKKRVVYGELSWIAEDSPNPAVPTTIFASKQKLTDEQADYVAWCIDTQLADYLRVNAHSREEYEAHQVDSLLTVHMVEPTADGRIRVMNVSRKDFIEALDIGEDKISDLSPAHPKAIVPSKLTKRERQEGVLSNNR